MTIPADYAERVYAGVLGKMIGVYLGRPFEGWTYDRIMAELGEVDYYVHDRRGVPLVVTDDDLSGTFTFVRALADNGDDPDLAPGQIGEAWLNYVIERRTIFWWGGLGNSTEHTAYLRLKHGIPAPESGSEAVNGKIIAEQIGAQIFIDGWAIVAPGDPEFAADLARRAASVSHDGEAIYGAQVIAAMESMAFVESDLDRLLDTGLSVIPAESIIARLITELREWRSHEPDWRKTRAWIAANYGYDKYRGPCHIVPNHAVIILALLYGDDDFQRSLMIANTAGWDTDCNSGNVGCLLGIKNGLAAIDAGPDWRGPVADRLYLPTADGGRAITDAVTETFHLVNTGRALAGEEPVTPKHGARFHFELPGAVQGFQVLGDNAAKATLENVSGFSPLGGRTLVIRAQGVEEGETVRVGTATFIPPDMGEMRGYQLIASPTLYSGQTLRAGIVVDSANRAEVTCQLMIDVYNAQDEIETMTSPRVALPPGIVTVLAWRVPDTGGQPIARAGIALGVDQGGEATVYLDWLTWTGTPDLTLKEPAGGGSRWRQAWVNAVDQFDPWWHDPYRLVQNEGTGLISQGTAAWTDYEVSATLRSTLAKSFGIGVRVQGLRRYYALLLGGDGKARLVKMRHEPVTLAETEFVCEPLQPVALSLRVEGRHLRGTIDGGVTLEADDETAPLTGGGVALIVEEGCLSCDAVRVAPTPG